MILRYHLLKLLQKFGKVKQFDFLFHKSGALEGQPRGYCFVNFETKQEAEKAIQCLNGKLALSKKLVVRWAHAQVKLCSYPRAVRFRMPEGRSGRKRSFSQRSECPLRWEFSGVAWGLAGRRMVKNVHKYSAQFAWRFLTCEGEDLTT
ncbi:probable RNA-binding protein 18 isoform X3 [Egretta garzetta]|uniref:probable RNA-binding protein 18 isoform X3 n=1 Tax=Egretta garzetta TaxID=188379 RepID=UPI00163B94C8|nr:probable RNA-binding protein 18 isoform X3 [Egretta garzetta]